MALGWFGNNANPIAVDFGTDSIKVLQVEPRDGGYRLVAAAGMQVPEDIRGSSAKRDDFAAEGLKKMLCEHGFKGKQAVTCLPAGHMAMQHMRMAKMGAEDLGKALRFEVAGKLPFDAGRAVIKHMIAGEVYDDSQTKTEVILMAASRESVDRHLAILGKAKLEVVGIHVEPVAILECFAYLFRRKGDEEISTMFIDIGSGSTHVVISHGKSLVFAKHVQIGGEYLTQHVARAIGKPVPETRQMRVQMAAAGANPRKPAGVLGIDTNGTQTHGHHNTANPISLHQIMCDKITDAMIEPIDAMITELELCVRYYESIFHGKSIDRLIFIGGESRNVTVCQQIAERLALPAILGDPMSRLLKDDKTKSTVDMRQPQPGWAVAVGLGVGISSN